MAIVVTREYLISLLNEWKNNNISIIDIYETANYLYDYNGTQKLDKKIEKSRYNIS